MFQTLGSHMQLAMDRVNLEHSHHHRKIYRTVPDHRIHGTIINMSKHLDRNCSNRTEINMQKTYSFPARTSWKNIMKIIHKREKKSEQKSAIRVQKLYAENHRTVLGTQKPP